MPALSNLIISWFKEAGRDLPWRRAPKDPYHVWISEVMSQQTRVEVVIPYFERFIRLFPTIESLANADDEALLKAWEGLGYYSRVRSLKKAAVLLMDSGQRTLPEELEALLKLPGIGPYTAGAILAFAFNKKGIAIDGNVKRVASRLFCIEHPLDSIALSLKVKSHLEELLREDEAPLCMEGVIELGALICTPIPKCSLCPLKEKCNAYAAGRQRELPYAKKRVAPTHIATRLALVVYEGGEEPLFLLHLPKSSGLFKGLSRFPCEEDVFDEKGGREDYMWERDLTEVVQTYTRYKETLFSVVYKTVSLQKGKELIWVTKDELMKLSMPSGHRRLRKMLLQELAEAAMNV